MVKLFSLRKPERLNRKTRIHRLGLEIGQRRPASSILSFFAAGEGPLVRLPGCRYSLRHRFIFPRQELFEDDHAGDG